jgi:hypothetical protein
LGFKTHESKLKNKREGAPQVKVKKGRRERGEGKAGRQRRKLQKSEEDNKIRRSATSHV